MLSSLDTRRILIRYVVQFLYVLNVTGQTFGVKFSVRDHYFVSWAVFRSVCRPSGQLGVLVSNFCFVWDAWFLVLAIAVLR